MLSKIFKIALFITATFFSFYAIDKLSFISYSYDYRTSNTEYTGIGNEIQSKVEPSIMHISIPKINVENDIYDKGSSYNDINKNVMIMKESDMPDLAKGNVIIGGHSGSGRLAYFKDFSLLDIGDEIFINYNDNKFSYIISNIYTDLKDGSIVIRRDLEKVHLHFLLVIQKIKIHI